MARFCHSCKAHECLEGRDASPGCHIPATRIQHCCSFGERELQGLAATLSERDFCVTCAIVGCCEAEAARAEAEYQMAASARSCRKLI